MNFKSVIVTSIALMFTLSACSSNNQSSEAAGLVITKAANEAEALAIVKSACEDMNNDFFFVLSEAIIGNFTDAARLDNQYKDDLANLMYYQFLDRLLQGGDLSDSDMSDLDFAIHNIRATCRVAGVIYKG